MYTNHLCRHWLQHLVWTFWLIFVQGRLLHSWALVRPEPAGFCWTRTSRWAMTACFKQDSSFGLQRPWFEAAQTHKGYIRSEATMGNISEVCVVHMRSNRTRENLGCQCLPRKAKRFSTEKKLRPILFAIVLQSLPWSFCNFMRESISSSENLAERNHRWDVQIQRVLWIENKYRDGSVARKWR